LHAVLAGFPDVADALMSRHVGADADVYRAVAAPVSGMTGTATATASDADRHTTS